MFGRKKKPPKMQALIAKENQRFSPLENQAKMIENKYLSFFFLIVVVGLFASLGYWSSVTEIDEITRGEGVFIPSSREQVIQSMDGGILTELKVHEGDKVKKGQILAKIDPTKAEADYAELRQKSLSLKALKARLSAESEGGKLKFPKSLRKHKRLMKMERTTYKANQRAIQSTVATLRKSHRLIADELNMMRPMVQRGAVSEVEVLKLERQANDLLLKIDEKLNDARYTASRELSKINGELSQIEERLKSRNHSLKRTTIKSPATGIVTNVYLTTVGGVVKPGGVLLEITPTDEELLVEAKIKPSDIGFLRPGLPVKVKVSAFDFLRYGALQGSLKHVSPDTIEEEKGGDSEPYYRALVELEKSFFEYQGKKISVIPGMTLTAEIKTGEKSILHYVVKPVLKLADAFTER